MYVCMYILYVHNTVCTGRERIIDTNHRRANKAKVTTTQPNLQSTYPIGIKMKDIQWLRIKKF